MQSYAISPDYLVLDRSSSGDYFFTIHDLPSEEKPREKLISRGPEAMSLRELLAAVLQVGTTREDVLAMSERIVRGYGENNIFSERDPKRLSEEADIPLAKACAIVAVGELGRRTYENHGTGFATVRNAKDAYEYLSEMRNMPKECLRALFLNGRNTVIRNEVISIGTVNSNIIHPREVFRPGIESNAAAVVLAHNHPSGDLTPSPEDIKITEQLIQAGKILGIAVLDHIIIAKDSFASVQAKYN